MNAFCGKGDKRSFFWDKKNYVQWFKLFQLQMMKSVRIRLIVRELTLFLFLEVLYFWA